jgi:hypothetical protein
MLHYLLRILVICLLFYSSFIIWDYLGFAFGFTEVTIEVSLSALMFSVRY